MSDQMLIHNVRPMGGKTGNLLIRDGRIRQVGEVGDTSGAEVVDGEGCIAIPGLVEAHTHLDKTVMGMGWYVNDVGPTLVDRIENERSARQRLGIDPARQSARQALLSVARGTTHIRTHVDVDNETGLAGIEGVMATRERYRDIVDIEIVAFPQSGLLAHAGTPALMDAAMGMGADVVGGLDPSAIDRDPKGSLDRLFGYAERYAKPLDIHLHEPGELGAFTTELIIERTLAHGMQDNVVIGHAFCLGMPDAARVAGLVERLARAGIHVMTTGPSGRPAPSVAQLRAAGVVVCAGNDGIRDTWGPYGNADMLERAMLLGLRNHFRRDEEVEWALEVCTGGGAQALGLEGYGLEPGDHADLVLAPGECLADLVVSRPPRALVVKRGRIVARGGEALAAAD